MSDCPHCKGKAYISAWRSDEYPDPRHEIKLPCDWCEATGEMTPQDAARYLACWQIDRISNAITGHSICECLTQFSKELKAEREARKA